MRISIESAELYTLLACKYNYDQVCELFQIPENQRSESFIGSQITERFKTYVTGYMGRKSLYERQSGAAFESPKIDTLPDPTFEGGFVEGENEQGKG